MNQKNYSPLNAVQLQLVDQMTDALLDSGLTVREARQVCGALRGRVEHYVSDRPIQWPGPDAAGPKEAV